MKHHVPVRSYISVHHEAKHLVLVTVIKNCTGYVRNDSAAKPVSRGLKEEFKKSALLRISVSRYGASCSGLQQVSNSPWKTPHNF